MTILTRTRTRRRRRAASLLLVLALLGALQIPLARGAVAEGETTALAFLVDGSGSINTTDWQIQKDGLSAALQDAATFPRDGSVAVAVVQWSFVSSSQRTRVEVPLTVINSQATVDSLVAQVQGMSQLGSLTNPGDGIRTGTDHLLAEAEGTATADWILCMSTDGTTNSGESLASATAYAQSSGVDKYSVIGIEDPPFANDIVLRDHYSPHVFGGGSVTTARNSIEFANLIVGGCLGDPVQLRALEVNQAVQDWRNSVPLTTGKRTVVRAFVEVPSGEDDQRVVGRLIGRRAGVELPGSPLLAINPGSSVLASEDVAARRGQLDASLNFSLPPSWRHGTVTLELDAAGAPLNCQEPSTAGGEPGDNCAVTVSFADEVEPEAVFVGVRYSNGGTTMEPSTGELLEQMFRFRSLLPVGDIDYRLDTMGDYSSAPSLSTVNGDLEIKRFFEAFFCLFGCSGPTTFDSRYYGVLEGDGGGLANNIPGTVSSGFLSGTGDRASTGYARNRGVHEYAHNLGRHHAVDPALPANSDGNLVGYCGEVASTSAPGHTPFETVGGNTRPVLGPLSSGADEEIWGLDNRFLHSDTNGLAVVDPRVTFELMSYCGGGPQGRYVSEFTYNGLRGSFPGSPSGPATGTGDDYVVATGMIDLSADTIDIGPLQQLTGAPPPPGGGDYTVELVGDDGSVLAAGAFSPIVMDADAPSPETQTGPPVGLMLVALPEPAGPIASVRVLHNGTQIGAEAASDQAPTVDITSPTGGETFDDATVTFEWAGGDVDGDPLSYTVLYSADDGNTYEVLTVNTPATSLTVPRADLEATTTGRLRVSASDGVNTTTVTSELFTVADNAPVVAIDTPLDGAVFSGLQDIDFIGAGYDTEDGALDGGSLTWTSNVDGALGSGAELTRNASELTEGTHVVTFTATGSGGKSTQAQVTIHVFRVAPPPPPSVMEVDVEVMPGSDPAPVNLRAQGVIPVVILSTEDFDAAAVDPATVCFGDAEDPAANGDCTEAHGRGHVEDVDGDGDADMVLHFEVQETGIQAGDTEACLVGRTVDGDDIAGCDAIVTRGG